MAKSSGPTKDQVLSIEGYRFDFGVDLDYIDQLSNFKVCIEYKNTSGSRNWLNTDNISSEVLQDIKLSKYLSRLHKESCIGSLKDGYDQQKEITGVDLIKYDEWTQKLNEIRLNTQCKWKFQVSLTSDTENPENNKKEPLVNTVQVQFRDSSIYYIDQLLSEIYNRLEAMAKKNEKVHKAIPVIEV